MSNNQQLANHQNQITSQEAERAIYIDFEGFTEEPPALLGILVEDEFEQIVLQQNLKSAADFKDLRTVSLSEILRELQSRCLTEKRYLVAFSIHESEVAWEHAQMDLSHIYKNALKIAKRWKYRMGLDPHRQIRSLKEYLAWLGFTIPQHLGNQKATKRLGNVISMIEKRGDFEACTPVVKAKWTKLLQYNMYDCEGTKFLTSLTTTKLDPAFIQHLKNAL